MNVQYSLIRKLISYKFEVQHNAAETTKNISGTECAGAVDRNTEIR